MDRNDSSVSVPRNKHRNRTCFEDWWRENREAIGFYGLARSEQPKAYALAMKVWVASVERAWREVKRLRRDCAQAYQVIGAMAGESVPINHDGVQRALDNLSAAASGRRRPHDRILPFVIAVNDNPFRECRDATNSARVLVNALEAIIDLKNSVHPKGEAEYIASEALARHRIPHGQE